MPSYVERFSDYVDDFSYWVNEIVKPKHYQRAVLLSHSMGGPITTGYLQEYSGQFTHVIMTAPMMEINTFAFDQTSAGLLAGTLNDLGFGHDYVPGEHDYDPSRAFPDCNTTSKARFDVGHALENSLPQVQLGGASIHWIKESLDFTSDLRKTPDAFQVPATLYQAGADSVVLPDGQNQICSLSPGFCKLVRLPDAKHEILFEKDSIRDAVIKEVRGALSKNDMF
jgi:lysophospholipase